MAAIEIGGFQPRMLDKVDRLLDLLDEKAGLSLFTLRSYEQGKCMPRAKQMGGPLRGTRRHLNSPDAALFRKPQPGDALPVCNSWSGQPDT